MPNSKPKVGEQAFDGCPSCDGEEGYLLLGAIVAIALVMIAMSVAAVKVSFELKREREVESVRRAQQYVRAIREYYLKFGRYPGSVEQLENTNNIRFLRQKYVDPLTGKADYRLIVVGQNKTTPTGFFGEPLGGLPGVGGVGTGSGAATANGAGTNGPSATGIGAGSGIANGIGANGAGAGLANGASAVGNTATMGFGSGNSAQAGAPGNGTQGTGTQPGAQDAGSNGLTGAGTGLLGSQGGLGSNLGPIMGVGSSATGAAIVAVNGQTTYETWEFLYDPRVERLRQAGQLNQGVASAAAGGNPAGMGGASQTGTGGAGTGLNSSGAAGSGAAGTNGSGAQPGGASPVGTQPAQP